MSDPDTQQGRPPPPPPPSGSPFGRFLTAQVLLAAVVSLVFGAFVYSSLGGRLPGGGGGDLPGDAKPTIAGTWASLPGADVGVQLELTGSGGTLTIGACAGELTPRGGDVFDYEETSGERGCPRRMRVTVSPVDPNTLEIDSRSFSGTLRRVG